MEFKRDNPPVRFTIPDRLSVGEELEYMSVLYLRPKKEWILARWDAAIDLIDEWECEDLPDPHDVDFASRDLPRTTSVIINWVAMMVWQHVVTQGEIEKK